MSRAPSHVRAAAPTTTTSARVETGIETGVAAAVRWRWP